MAFLSNGTYAINVIGADRIGEFACAKFSSRCRRQAAARKVNMKRVVLFSGASAVGKTAALRQTLPILQSLGARIGVCKIDCLQSDDAQVYEKIDLPCVTGISGDICPDHFLVSNLAELWDWNEKGGRDTLVIETAGLCHRCSPATERMVAGCVLDCTASSKAPAQSGPMLTEADFAVLTKIDMVSQAELEIISWQIRQINPGIALFPMDGLAGYGADRLAGWLYGQKDEETAESDTLRHTMPSGVCSYCVGERRVGTAFQQGVVGKIFDTATE